MDRDAESENNTATADSSSSPPPALDFKLDLEKTAEGEAKITLSEEQALRYARTNSHDNTLLYICFGVDDNDCPRNWSRARRWYIAAFSSWLNVLTSFNISDTSIAFTDMSKEFGVSLGIMTLAGLTMVALGGGFGPLFWGPLSERYGRRPTMLASQFLLFILQLGLALAPNIGTIFAMRFLTGFLGVAPASNTGGTIHDLFSRDEAGPPLSLYAISTVTSPGLTLVVTGYIVQNKGWRWIYWITMIVFGAFWLLAFTIPETRHSIILQKKAERVKKTLQEEDLNDRVTDENADERKGLSTLFKITLTRPIRFLFTEPIVQFSALYNAFLFGLVYIFQGSFTLVFGKTGHGFNTGEQGLSFLGLVVGTLTGAALNPIQDRYYVRRITAAGKGVPEARMWMARWGSFLFPISLFWFGWTSYQSVHWIVPIIASAFFGIGFFIILMALLSYVYDSYGTYTSSALAGLLFLRGLVGTFPLFGTQMYNNLGYEWASSLLGFLSLLLIPIPFVYFYKGEALRWRSRWAREHFDQKEDKA